MKDLPTIDAAEWLGVSYRTILSTAKSGGAISITEVVGPLHSSPPRHIHHAEDETFVVLSGEVEFWIEGDTVVLQAGETGFVARGREHSYRVIGDGPARQLVILTPGGFEGFWADMVRGQFRVPQDMDAINESAERHNLSFTGPPLGV